MTKTEKIIAMLESERDAIEDEWGPGYAGGIEAAIAYLRTPEGQEMWAIENEDRHLFCIQGDQEKVANNARYFEASNKAKYKVVPVLVTKKED